MAFGRINCYRPKTTNRRSHSSMELRSKPKFQLCGGILHEFRNYPKKNRVTVPLSFPPSSSNQECKNAPHSLGNHEVRTVATWRGNTKVIGPRPRSDGTLDFVLGFTFPENMLEDLFESPSPYYWCKVFYCVKDLKMTKCLQFRAIDRT